MTKLYMREQKENEKMEETFIRQCIHISLEKTNKGREIMYLHLERFSPDCGVLTGDSMFFFFNYAFYIRECLQ